jgi:hypothetical protein
MIIIIIIIMKKSIIDKRTVKIKCTKTDHFYITYSLILCLSLIKDSSKHDTQKINDKKTSNKCWVSTVPVSNGSCWTFCWPVTWQNPWDKFFWVSHELIRHSCLKRFGREGNYCSSEVGKLWPAHQIQPKRATEKIDTILFFIISIKYLKLKTS